MPVTPINHQLLARLEPTPKGSPVTILVNSLTSAFLSGDVAPGGKLPPERQLAETMGVGRGQIREALKTLDLLGLIEIRQGDGTYLRNTSKTLLTDVVQWGLMLDAPEAKDLMDARACIEPAIAGLAAQRATDADIAAIDSALAAMRGADDVSAFAAADTEFHLAVAAAAHNNALSGVLHGISSLLRVWVLRVIRQPGEREAALSQHDAILDGIRERNHSTASTAMDEHIGSARTALDRALADPRR